MSATARRPIVPKQRDHAVSRHRDSEKRTGRIKTQPATRVIPVASKPKTPRPVAHSSVVKPRAAPQRARRKTVPRSAAVVGHWSNPRPRSTSTTGARAAFIAGTSAARKVARSPIAPATASGPIRIATRIGAAGTLKLSSAVRATAGMSCCASRMPSESPSPTPPRPTRRPSFRSSRVTTPRRAPRARVTPTSQRRWTNTVESRLKAIRNPTSRATRARPSSIRRKPAISLRTPSLRLAASSTVIACGSLPTRLRPTSSGRASCSITTSIWLIRPSLRKASAAAYRSMMTTLPPNARAGPFASRTPRIVNERAPAGVTSSIRPSRCNPRRSMNSRVTMTESGWLRNTRGSSICM